jgi:tight adherence protein B
MTALFVALMVGGGLAMLAGGYLMRARERDDELKAILDLPFGENDLPSDAVEAARNAFLESGVSLVHAGLDRLDVSARIRSELERARLPLRPGEFVLIAAGFAVGLAGVAYMLTSRPPISVVVLAVVPWLAWQLLKGRAERRRKALEAQIPEALSLVAASLEAGHTFLRSVEMMVEESEPPLSQEFERVLADTRLGDPLVDALQRMADRLQVRDMAWVVQAIRIQQTVGGRLAELLATLAEFMRAREEMRREVRVLTAEGKLSAFVLGGLPFVLFFIIQTMNPSYLAPMLHGWGLAALGGAAAMVFAGMGVILRMARVEV